MKLRNCKGLTKIELIIVCSIIVVVIASSAIITTVVSINANNEKYQAECCAVMQAANRIHTAIENELPDAPVDMADGLSKCAYDYNVTILAATPKWNREYEDGLYLIYNESDGIVAAYKIIRGKVRASKTN